MILKFALPTPLIEKLPRPADLRGHWRRPTLPDRSDLALGAGLVCLLAALLFVFAGPGLQEVRRSSLETAVRNNAATLQLAAETYAAAHQGRYPADPHDLLPWLPDDRPPLNPLTGRPVDFRPEPGDLTYRTPNPGQDYLIEGWGAATAAAPVVTLRGRAPATARLVP